MQVGSVQAKTTNLLPQSAQPARTSSFAYYDPADTNKDGIVSGAEALAYSLAHPQLGAHKAASSASTHPAQASTVHPPAAYTQRATLNATSPFQHGLLDLKA